MTSANNNMARNAVDGGGNSSTSANNQLTGSVAEEVPIAGAASATTVLRAGFETLAYFPGTLTALTSGATAANGITLNWATPGYDGNNSGTAQAGSVYYVQIASQVSLGSFANLNNITVSVSTSGTVVGTVVGANASGLDPNTTYYAQVFLRDSDGNVPTPFSTDYTTFTTLAAAPTVGALEFLSVQPGSATVAWIGPDPAAVSSMTNEGYVLQASSNNFGVLSPPGAPVFSSTTFSPQASTLTVAQAGAVPLDLSNTYYFQVASLNWAGQPNYATFTKLNFQIQQSTWNLHLGAIDPNVARSTVATSSMVVTNVGNWPLTVELSASMITAGGSPWTLGVAPGVETPVLEGVFNSGIPGPPATSFNTFITGSTVAASGSYYAGNYNAVQIPPGASRTLWFYFTIPSSSISLGPETIQVLSQGVYP